MHLRPMLHGVLQDGGRVAVEPGVVHPPEIDEPEGARASGGDPAREPPPPAQPAANTMGWGGRAFNGGSIDGPPKILPRLTPGPRR